MDENIVEVPITIPYEIYEKIKQYKIDKNIECSIHDCLVELLKDIFSERT